MGDTVNSLTAKRGGYVQAA